MKTLKEQNQETEYSSEYIFQDGLRKVSPYYFMYNTFAKGRWLNKSILSVFQKEFQDRPPAYYRAAIESGRITVNGKKVTIDYIFKNSDKVCHPIHRHEPPVSDKPVKIIYIDDDVLIVDKPSSLPVHPTGRYHLNTLMKITAHQTQVESINGITLNSNELYRNFSLI